MNCDKDESLLRLLDYFLALTKVSKATAASVATTTTTTTGFSKRIKVCLDPKRSFYGLLNDKAVSISSEYECLFSMSLRSQKKAIWLKSSFRVKEATIDRASRRKITLSRLGVAQQRLIIIHLSSFEELFENSIRTQTMLVLFKLLAWWALQCSLPNFFSPTSSGNNLFLILNCSMNTYWPPSILHTRYSLYLFLFLFSTRDMCFILHSCGSSHKQ